MPVKLDLKQGSYSGYEPCLKFRFLIRFLPRRQDDAIYCVQRVTNITDLKRELSSSRKDLDLFVEPSILTSTMSTQVYQTYPHSVAAVPSAAMVYLLQKEERLERFAALHLDPLRLRA